MAVLTYVLSHTDQTYLILDSLLRDVKRPGINDNINLTSGVHWHIYLVAKRVFIDKMCLDLIKQIEPIMAWNFESVPNPGCLGLKSVYSMSQRDRSICRRTERILTVIYYHCR